MNTLNAISSILVATAIKVTVLLLLAWCAAQLLRKLSSAMRHLLLVIAVAASLALPFSALLPQWRVRGFPVFMAKPLPAVAPPAGSSAPATSLPAAAAVPETANTLPYSHAPNSRVQLASSRGTRRHAQREAEPAQRPDATIAPQTKVEAGVTAARPHRLDFAWPVLLALVWLLGTLVFLVRSLSNRSRVRWLLRRATVLSDAGWNTQVRAAAAAMGITRHVALLVSSETGIPLTMGTLFPAVVLPPDYCEWSPLRREAVLHHELAHIKRMDAFTQVLAEVATALYWWNPLVWLIARAMRMYRERACDDTVLAAGTRASEYAHELLDIVSALHHPELGSA
ncbi:MAG: M56 family metallopeptidase, partial [Actinomycetota bacterium]